MRSEVIVVLDAGKEYRTDTNGLTPMSSGGSSRAPVLTKKPTAAVCAEGLVSAMTVRKRSRSRLGRARLWHRPTG